MSALGRTLGQLAGRRLGRRPRVVHVRPDPEKPALTESQRELTDKRERLTRDLAELQWDLGGLTYEMAIRDHFRLDVLTRHAAQLQEVDAELGSVERLVYLEESGAAGSCQVCGALHARGAVFCWQCGTSLMERAPMGGAPGQSGDAADGLAGLDRHAAAETDDRAGRFQRPEVDPSGPRPPGEADGPNPRSPLEEPLSSAQQVPIGARAEPGPQSPAGPQSPERDTAGNGDDSQPSSA